MEIRVGDSFVHDSYIDPDWTPEPGQKWADGPKARMLVTKVTSLTVWYASTPRRNAKGRIRAKMPRSVFEARYGSVLSTAGRA